jgi:hypothetical protein
VFIQGIRFDEQRWPEGKEWVHVDRFHQRSQRVRAVVLKWRDPELRQEALDMLVHLQTMYGEQTELVYRKQDPRLKFTPETQSRLWDEFATVL